MLKYVMHGNQLSVSYLALPQYVDWSHLGWSRLMRPLGSGGFSATDILNRSEVENINQFSNSD